MHATLGFLRIRGICYDQQVTRKMGESTKRSGRKVGRPKATQVEDREEGLEYWRRIVGYHDFLEARCEQSRRELEHARAITDPESRSKEVSLAELTIERLEIERRLFIADFAKVLERPLPNGASELQPANEGYAYRPYLSESIAIVQAIDALKDLIGSKKDGSRRKLKRDWEEVASTVAGILVPVVAQAEQELGEGDRDNDSRSDADRYVDLFEALKDLFTLGDSQDTSDETSPGLAGRIRAIREANKVFPKADAPRPGALERAYLDAKDNVAFAGLRAGPQSLAAAAVAYLLVTIDPRYSEGKSESDRMSAAEARIRDAYSSVKKSRSRV